jgi:NADPH-dependent 2,4-dienoyl-CoA reductase/sulfur reductase-like enzyme
MRILIVGGVAAGMSAAARARRNAKDATIVVFERGEVVSFGACGLPYYVGGWFDDPAYMIARTAAQMIESGIDVRLRHEAIGVNAQAKTLRVRNLNSGEVVDEPYDRLMIATGAMPIRPPFPGIDLANVHFLTRLDDGKALRTRLESPDCQRVAVIGAGFIGVEAVEACLHRGKAVSLVQLDPRILVDAFDTEVTDLLERELVAKGVDLRVSTKVTALEGRGGAVCAFVTEAGRIEADTVIVAVGVRPATAFLAGSGIAMGANGAILTDTSGRANLPDIYAAGDCATVPAVGTGSPVWAPLATGANKLGRVVGDALAGKPARYPGSLRSACIKVLGLEAGRTGLSEEDARKAGIPVKTVWVQDKDHANYWPGQSDIAVKLVYDPVSRALLGGQVVGGQGAVLRADVLATAITGGLTVDHLGMLDLCYAPPFARTWDVLNVAGNVAR